MSVILPNVIMRGTFAGRPAASSAGSLYFASDTGKQYRDNGTSWDEVTPPGGASVTSVALTMPPEFSVSGSPITSTGTLVVNKGNQSANLVYAGPSTGSAAAPTFRSLVAADFPAQPYDLNCALVGKPGASAVVFIFTAVRAVTFAANFSGAFGSVGANPTSTAAYIVKNGATTIGTVSISTGGVFTFTTTSGTSKSLSAGDRLTITAPTSQDATLSDVGFTLSGTR